MVAAKIVATRAVLDRSHQDRLVGAVVVLRGILGRLGMQVATEFHQVEDGRGEVADASALREATFRPMAMP